MKRYPSPIPQSIPGRQGGKNLHPGGKLLWQLPSLLKGEPGAQRIPVQAQRLPVVLDHAVVPAVRGHIAQGGGLIEQRLGGIADLLRGRRGGGHRIREKAGRGH